MKTAVVPVYEFSLPIRQFNGIKMDGTIRGYKAVSHRILDVDVVMVLFVQLAKFIRALALRFAAPVFKTSCAHCNMHVQHRL